MATLTINPNAAGDITNISTVTGAATHWQAVSKGSVSDTSFVSDTGVAGTFVGDLYKFDTAALSGTINSVTLFARIAREANGFMVQNFSLKTNGTTFDYTWTDPANGAFDTQSSGVLTTNPQTTLAWTLSDVQNIQAGPKIRGFTDPGDPACSWIYIVVDYNPAPKGSNLLLMGVG